MKRPLALSFSLLVIFIVAGTIAYRYGVPLLHDSNVTCKVGPGKSMGCHTAIGNFAIVWFMGVGLAVGAAWSRFGRY